MTSIHVWCVNHSLAMMPATDSPIRLFNRATRVLSIIIVAVNFILITFVIIPWKKFTEIV